MASAKCIGKWTGLALGGRYHIKCATHGNTPSATLSCVVYISLSVQVSRDPLSPHLFVIYVRSLHLDVDLLGTFTSYVGNF